MSNSCLTHISNLASTPVDYFCSTVLSYSMATLNRGLCQGSRSTNEHTKSGHPRCLRRPHVILHTRAQIIKQELSIWQQQDTYVAPRTCPIIGASNNEYILQIFFLMSMPIYCDILVKTHELFTTTCLSFLVLVIIVVFPFCCHPLVSICPNMSFAMLMMYKIHPFNGYSCWINMA